jgi:hypothetical protein
MEPIYRTDGAWVAVYEEGHIFTIDGEWVGFVVGRQVFDPAGEYVGFMSDDRRLLRKRVLSDPPPRRDPPPRPPRPKIPATMPLAPLLREIPYHIIDVFEEYAEELMYISETRPDME